MSSRVIARSSIRRRLLLSFEMSNRPLVRVIVDPNPMDNLHDPFLLYVALRPSGRNPRRYASERVTPFCLRSG